MLTVLKRAQRQIQILEMMQAIQTTLMKRVRLLRYLMSLMNLAALILTLYVQSIKTGDTFNVALVETAEKRTQNVDLWVAVLMPNNQFLFRKPSPFQPFVPEPQAFKTDLSPEQLTHNIMQFEVINGLEGEYVFYAVLVKAEQRSISGWFKCLCFQPCIGKHANRRISAFKHEK